MVVDECLEDFCAYPYTPETMNEDRWSRVCGMCAEMVDFDCPLRIVIPTDPTMPSERIKPSKTDKNAYLRT